MSALTWIMIGIVILIITIIIWAYYYGRGAEPDPEKTEVQRLKERVEVDRLEGNFIAWFILATIFLIMTIRIKSFGPGGIHFSILFMIITIILFMLAIIDYVIERNTLKDDGITPRSRLDYLFIIAMVITVASVFLLYYILKYDKNYAHTIINK